MMIILRLSASISRPEARSSATRKPSNGEEDQARFAGLDDGTVPDDEVITDEAMSSPSAGDDSWSPRLTANALWLPRRKPKRKSQVSPVETERRNGDCDRIERATSRCG